jgi:hypothetical protein
MYSGGGHLGFPIGIKNLKFVEDLSMIIPVQLIIGRPSTKFMFSMSIGNPSWPPPQEID